MRGEGKKQHAANGREESDLLTVREVAKQLRVDDTTVRRWIKNGALEAVTLPHVSKRQAYRVHRHVFDTIVNGSTVDQWGARYPQEQRGE